MHRKILVVFILPFLVISCTNKDLYHGVEKYEADKTDSLNKADAVYFVSKLKAGTVKNNLQERLGQIN